MNPFSPRPLIYVHLPKAGGSTMQELIVRQYKGGRSFIFTGDPAQYAEFLAFPPQERASFDVLLGHVQYGLHRHLPDPATCITMLRDPVDRVVSHYHFILARPEHYLHDGLRRSGYSLREWVLQTPVVVDSYQVRWLIERPLAEVPPGGVTEEMLAEAQHNLRHGFSVVGLLERFDESLACLARALGWSDVEPRGRLNANPDRPELDEIDEETRAAVREVNRFDIELYRTAQDIFEDQCRRLGIAGGEAEQCAPSTAAAARKDDS